MLSSAVIFRVLVVISPGVSPLPSLGAAQAMVAQCEEDVELTQYWPESPQCRKALRALAVWRIVKDAAYQRQWKWEVIEWLSKVNDDYDTYSGIWTLLENRMYDEQRLLIALEEAVGSREFWMGRFPFPPSLE